MLLTTFTSSIQLGMRQLGCPGVTPPCTSAAAACLSCLPPPPWQDGGRSSQCTCLWRFMPLHQEVGILLPTPSLTLPSSHSSLTPSHFHSHTSSLTLPSSHPHPSSLTLPLFTLLTLAFSLTLPHSQGAAAAVQQARPAAGPGLHAVQHLMHGRLSTASEWSRRVLLLRHMLRGSLVACTHLFHCLRCIAHGGIRRSGSNCSPCVTLLN